MRHPFLIMGLATYPEWPLISFLFSPVAFFTAAILLFPFSILFWKEFLHSVVQYKVHSAASHIALKVGGWQHFHSSLPTLQTSSPLEPSPPIMTYNNKKIRDSRNLIPSNLLINDHSRKLVTVKCNRENKYSQILAHLRYVSISCSSITLWPSESLRFNRNRYLCVTEKVLPGRLHPNKFRPGLGLDFGLGLG